MQSYPPPGGVKALSTPEEILERATAKDSRDRFPSAEAARIALLELKRQTEEELRAPVRGEIYER